jgi:hypothetical protein
VENELAHVNFSGWPTKKGFGETNGGATIPEARNIPAGGRILGPFAGVGKGRFGRDRLREAGYIEPEMVRTVGKPVALENLSKSFMQFPRLQIKIESSATDSRQVEKVVDKFHQPPAIAMRELDGLMHRNGNRSDLFCGEQCDHRID